MVEIGHVVKEFKIGNTTIRFCDDYCRDKTEEQVQEILDRIARNTIRALSVAAAKKEAERKEGE